MGISIELIELIVYRPLHYFSPTSVPSIREKRQLNRALLKPMDRTLFHLPFDDSGRKVLLKLKLEPEG